MTHVVRTGMAVALLCSLAACASHPAGVAASSSPRPVATAVVSPAALSNAQLKSLFTGVTVLEGNDHSGRYIAHHYPDGRVVASSGKYRSAGTWKIEGNLVVVRWSNPDWKSGAWFFEGPKDGKYTIRLAYTDGNGSSPPNWGEKGRVAVTDVAVSHVGA